MVDIGFITVIISALGKIDLKAIKESFGSKWCKVKESKYAPSLTTVFFLLGIMGINYLVFYFFDLFFLLSITPGQLVIDWLAGISLSISFKALISKWRSKRKGRNDRSVPAIIDYSVRVEISDLVTMEKTDRGKLSCFPTRTMIFNSLKSRKLIKK